MYERAQRKLALLPHIHNFNSGQLAYTHTEPNTDSLGDLCFLPHVKAGGGGEGGGVNEPRTIEINKQV